jgi:hypothetical protein
MKTQTELGNIIENKDNEIAKLRAELNAANARVERAIKTACAFQQQIITLTVRAELAEEDLAALRK